MEYYFAKNLHFLRRKLGVTQSELSVYMNKAHTTIGNWEKRNSRPSIEELLELSQYFKVSVGDFLEKDLSKQLHLNDEPVWRSRLETSHQHEEPELWDVNLLLQQNDIQKRYIEILQKENQLLQQILNEKVSHKTKSYS